MSYIMGSADPRADAPVLHGRQRETQLLRESLKQLSDGHGALVLVSGEAGIGKTTLVDTLTVEAATEEITILAATAYDQEVPTPYGLWQEVMRGVEALGGLAESPLSLADPAKLEHVGGARELWDLVTRQMLAIAEQRPVLLVLEDLHWADQSSLELLRYFARQAAQAPILIIMTYRDIDLTPAYPLYHLLPHLVRDIRPTRITLRPLEAKGIAELVSHRYAGMDSASVQRLTEYLARYAEGNPLFVEEILGLLEEQRVLTRQDNDWHLGELPGFAVPPLIRQIIEERIDNLSPAAREALEVAAVIGIEVPLEVWAEALRTAESDDLTAIEDVLRTSMVEETSRPDVLRFRHTLVRDAIYGNTNVVHRRQWHDRIGEILSKRAEVDPGIVAHHFIQADNERASDWLIESAQRAGRTFALQAAMNGYERALDILKQNPERLSERVGVLSALAEAYRFTNTRRALVFVHEAVDLAEQIDDPGAQVLSSWVYARVRGFDDQNVLDDLIDAAEAFDRLPEHEQERIAGSPLGYVVSPATLAQDLANYGMFAAALEQAEKFLAGNTRPASRARYIEFGNAHFGAGIACAALGNPSRARTEFETARGYFRESGNFQMLSNCYYWELSSVIQVYYADQPGERHRLQLEEVRANLQSEFVEAHTGERHDSTSETLILDGDWDTCWRNANLRLDIPASRVPSARKLAEIEWLRGNITRAWTHIRTALPAGPDERPGRRFFLHRQDLQEIAAMLALDEGDTERARRWIEAFEDWLAWSGRTTGRANAELLRARLESLNGNLARAVEHAGAALALTSDPPRPLAKLRALRSLGELSLATDRLTDARRYLDEALELAGTCAAPFEQALTRVSLAELLSRTGAPDQAGEILPAARETAGKLEAGRLLDRIDGITHQLVQLSGPPVKEESPLGLTPRQIEVLKLLARGMTDAEIADALFISPRTVHGHLNTIYGKLGVESRTGAVARAFSEGIVSV